MWPLIELAIEPRSRADDQKLRAALAQMLASVPSFSSTFDPESGQTLLRGNDEDQLQSWIRSLRETCGIGLNVGAPQVAYREGITRSAEVRQVHRRLIGAAGEFASVTLAFEPAAADSGFTFVTAFTDLPTRFGAAVRDGVAAAAEHGLIAGFPVIDFKATLTAGAWHDTDSSERAFRIAAAAAFHELRHTAEPVLLEPVMRVDVSSPAPHLAQLIADLQSRRGVVRAGPTADGKLVALAPLSNMVGYKETLDAITGGAGAFAMTYDHYAPVPQQPADGDPGFSPAIGMRA